MDFINKIYNSDYFVIGLFILIGILAAIFIILVFSGRKKKDTTEQSVNNAETNDLTKNLETINNVTNDGMVNNVPQPQPTVTEPVQSMVMTNDIAQPAVSNTVAEPTNIDMMSFGQEAPIETPVQEPERIEVSPINPEPVVEENKNDNLFNTSIFHGMPSEIMEMSAANMENETPSVEENKNDITANLFQPVPDLDTVPVDIPVATSESTVETTNIDFNLPTIEPIVQPEVPSVDIPAMATNNIDLPKTELPNTNIEEQPKVQMPTQFSSVYVNKEDNKVEKPVVSAEPTSVNPPYDPTLFQSILKPNPEPKVEQSITPEVTNVENNVQSANATQPAFKTPVMNNANPFSALDNNVVSTMDNIIPEVPALEPLPSMENTNVNIDLPKVNPNNTFDFSLPTLAEENSTNNSTQDTNNTSNTNATFPNFGTETYDIK